MKLEQLLKKFAGMAGIENQKELTDFLEANKDALQVEFPDVAVNLITENVLSMTDAQNNGKLKTHYAGLLFNGLEQGAKERALALGLSQEKIDEINKTTQATGQRINAYFEAAKELLESAKKGGKGNAEFEKQLAEEQKKYLEFEKQSKQQLADLENRHTGEIENFAWGTKVSNVKINAAIPDYLRTDAVKGAVQKEVEKLGGVLKFNKETRSWDIVQKDNPEMKVVSGGKVLDFETIFPLSLQTHKLLETADPGGTGPKPGPSNPFTGLPNSGSNEPAIPSYVMNSLGSANKPVELPQQ